MSSGPDRPGQKSIFVSFLKLLISLNTGMINSRYRRGASRRSRSREHHRAERPVDRRRSRSAERTRRRHEEERIDKKKLLAIAKKNATYLLKEQQERMLQAGVLPATAATSKTGKSVAELTGDHENKSKVKIC
jgi:hypothetical protein